VNGTVTRLRPLAEEERLNRFQSGFSVAAPPLRRLGFEEDWIERPPPQSSVPPEIVAEYRAWIATQTPSGLLDAHRGVADEWVSPASWQGQEPPPRRWMIQGCVTAGNVMLVSGDGSIGKTLLLLQLCAATAIGKVWLGLSPIAGRSIYLVTEEDEDEIKHRIHNVAKSLDVEKADIGESMLLRMRAGQDNRLIRFEYGEPITTNLWTSLLLKARSFGASYVVLDTAAQTFGGNLSNQTQVTAYLNQLRRLAIAIQGVVILTQHPSDNGSNNGSGRAGTRQWENSVRSRLYFRKTKTGGRELAGMKNNYGLPLDPIALRYERGVFVPDIPAPRMPYSE